MNMKKSKNIRDLNLINLKAAKKREATLKVRVAALEVLVRAQQRDISWLLTRVEP